MGKWVGNRLKNGLLHGMFDAPLCILLYCGNVQGWECISFSFLEFEKEAEDAASDRGGLRLIATQ